MFTVHFSCSFFFIIDGFETVISERETTLFDPEVTTDKLEESVLINEFDTGTLNRSILCNRVGIVALTYA